MIKRGLGRVQRVAQLRRNRAGRRVLILLYHRIAESHSDPWALNVTPNHFAEHLQVLREHTQLIPLQDLSRALFDGSREDWFVVVTFDDG